MDKKIFYLILFIAFASIIVISRQRQAQPNVLSSSTFSSGKIIALQNTYDFGTIKMYEGKAEYNYELRNDSDTAVTLGELYTSCMCTTAQVIYPNGTESRIAGMKGHGTPTFLRQPIEVGETFQIRTVFDPTAHGPAGTGPVRRVIYLETNSQETPTIELSFDANVVL